MTTQSPPLPAGSQTLQFGKPVLPYATPAPLVTGGPAPDSAWRDGKTLVVRKGVILPDRCVKCNAPADGPFHKQTVNWHHPALYLLLLAGPVPYAIIISILQEKGSVGVRLCARHRQRRLGLVLTAWALGIGGTAAIVASARAHSRFVVIAGIAALFCGVVLGACTRLLTAKKIDGHFMWLRGLSPEFLTSFPPLPHRHG
jgi:hypothetical protein